MSIGVLTWTNRHVGADGAPGADGATGADAATLVDRALQHSLPTAVKRCQLLGRLGRETHL
jgi:hypothetical protein